jgi:hypothetical protein
MVLGVPTGKNPEDSNLTSVESLQRVLLGVKGRPGRKADNLTDINEPIV